MLLELAKGKSGTLIDLMNDTLSIYFSNATPNRATHTVKGDLAEITSKNGYTGMVDLVTTSRGIISNKFVIVANDIQWTGSTVTDGTGFGPFRWMNLVSKTSSATDANRRLLGYMAYTSTVTVTNGNVFNIDFSSVDGALRLMG